MYRPLAVAILILCAALPAFAAGVPVVMVGPSAEVAGASVTLGDIATVQCSDTAAAAKIRDAVVCSAPLPGKVRLLTRAQIMVALRKIGYSEKTIGLLAPNQTAIQRTANTVTGESIAEAAKQYALTAQTWPGTAGAEERRMPADVMVPSGAVELRAGSAGVQLRPGQNSVQVEILVDGRRVTTSTVTLTIKLVAKVLVATQSIARRAPLDASNTEYQDRDVTSVPGDVLTEAQIEGMVASTSIAPGSIIRRSYVTAPTVVKTGDQVLLIVTNGAVRLSQRVTAAQDGRVGDTVKVNIDGSARSVRAVVAEPGVVTIQIGRR